MTTRIRRERKEASQGCRAFRFPEIPIGLKHEMELRERKRRFRALYGVETIDETMKSDNEDEKETPDGGPSG